MMKLALLASLTLISVVLASCPTNYAIPNLVADSLQITVAQPKANSSQNHQYTMASPMPVDPSVAIALQDFSVSSVVAHDFYIIPSKVSTTSIVFTFAYTTPIWTKIRFNFWASANN